MQSTEPNSEVPKQVSNGDALLEPCFPPTSSGFGFHSMLSSPSSSTFGVSCRGESSVCPDLEQTRALCTAHPPAWAQWLACVLFPLTSHPPLLALAMEKLALLAELSRGAEPPWESVEQSPASS